MFNPPGSSSRKAHRIPSIEAPLTSRRCVRLASLLALSPAILVAQGAPTPLDTVRVTSRTGTTLVAPARSVETITREDLDRRAGQAIADSEVRSQWK